MKKIFYGSHKLSYLINLRHRRVCGAFLLQYKRFSGLFNHETFCHEVYRDEHKNVWDVRKLCNDSRWCSNLLWALNTNPFAKYWKIVNCAIYERLPLDEHVNLISKNHDWCFAASLRPRLLHFSLIYRLGFAHRLRRYAGQPLRWWWSYTSAFEAQEEILRILHGSDHKVLGWFGEFDGWWILIGLINFH